jgi:hypothetical protein
MALRIKVTQKPELKGKCGGVEFKVQWQLGAGDTGWVIQHVTWAHDVKKCDGTKDFSGTVPCSNTPPGEFWEAWRVEAGKVFIGRGNSPHVADTYRFVDHPDRKGSHGVTGRVKFMAGYDLKVGTGADEWLENDVPPAGSLPTRRKAPAGWTDDATRHHDLTVTWVCCPGGEEDAHVTSDPTDSDEGVARGPADRVRQTLASMPSWPAASLDAAAGAALLGQLASIRGTTLPQLRQGAQAFVTAASCGGELGVDDASKLFLLNRYAFRLPPTATLGDWRFFGGWLIPLRGRTFSPAWPFAATAAGANVRLVGKFAGYTGDDYDGLGELGYFAELFPLRWA